MKFSIITINLNNREGLSHTMKSILSQTCQDFEYIIIDGGSTDGSCEVIEAERERLAYYASEPDSGIYHAMNKGIAVAHGDYCLFMNSGDMLHDVHVLERVNPLLQDKDFYIGDMKQRGEHHHLKKAPVRLTAASLANRYLPHQSTFIRTALLKARPYREDLRIVSDWEQMFYEFIIGNASYERLPLIVADFDTSGISSNPRFEEVKEKEHRQVLHELFPPRLVESLIGEDTFGHKVRLAVGKQPLERDLKILRNVLKVLPRDLWRACFGKD